MSVAWRLRAAILTLIGILAVHQGRYLFAPAEHEHELSTAHSYLVWLAPASAILVLLAVLHLAVHAGRARDADRPQLPGTRTLWPTVTTALLGAFAAQESLELVLSHGHLPELADLLGGGGWTAIPFAVAAGGAIALLLRGAARVVRWVAGRRRRALARQHAPLAHPLPRSPVVAVPRSVLARRLAGRGPPVLS